MTTRRGLFGLFAGLAAAPVVRQLIPPAAAASLEPEIKVSYPGNWVAGELPSHTHKLSAFRTEVSRDYIRKNLYNCYGERLAVEEAQAEAFYEGSQWEA